MNSRIALVLSIALSACDGSLASRDLAALKLVAYGFPPSVGHALRVEIDSRALVCPVLANVKATQNGVVLVQSIEGAQVCATDESGRRECYCRAPEWNLAVLDAEPSTTFVLDDGAHQVTAEFQQLVGPRSLRVVGPESASARPGDAIELEWIPTTDLLPSGNTEVSFLTPGVAVSLAFGAALTVSGTRLSFTVEDLTHQLPSTPTTGVLRATSGEPRVGFARCEGIARCEAEFLDKSPAPEIAFTLSQ